MGHFCRKNNPLPLTKPPYPMKMDFQKRPVKGFLFTIILPLAILRANSHNAQNGPPPVATTAASYAAATHNTNDASNLPIQFVAVHAKRDGLQVQLNWEVNNESEITNYIIERSYTGNDFFTAGIVGNKPANGNPGKYNFSDAAAGNKETRCYRIIAQDTDGQKIISKIISIQTVLQEEPLEISPVPATSYSAITWLATSNIQLDITLFNAAGHAVLSRQYPLKTGVNELLLTNLETLRAGTYMVKGFDGVHHRSGKLIIHHTM